MERTTQLDVQEFWAENAAGEAFPTNKPRCALSFSPDDHWLFECAHAPSTLRHYQDKGYRGQLHREVNRATSTSWCKSIAGTIRGELPDAFLQ